MNTGTGAIAPFAVNGPDVEQFIDNPVRFHLDGNFVAYARAHSSPSRFRLVKYDLKLDRETEFEIPGLASDLLPDGPGQYRNRPALLPDGRTFLFNRATSSNTFSLVRHDLATGAQSDFATSSAPIGVIDGHPRQMMLVTSGDGGRLVFTSFSLDGSEWRPGKSVALPEGFEFRGQHWGGPRLFLAKTEAKNAPPRAESELWIVSVATGELKSLGFTVPEGQYWSLFEDQERVLFHTRSPASHGIWRVENVLPETPPEK